MGSEASTIQSLKAVDAWIDVINANINGGVRTAFKSSRLKFAGSNVDLQRAGTSTALPLQIPESGLTTANTIIDFTQGAVTASTEVTHLAIQGEGFFVLISPESINQTAGAQFGATLPPTSATRLLITRDGEFRTNQNGLLVHSSGYFLVCYSTPPAAPTQPYYGTVSNGYPGSGTRAVYNDIEGAALAVGAPCRLSNFLANTGSGATGIGFDYNGFNMGNTSAIMKVASGKQNLQYSKLGSTVFEFGDDPLGGGQGALRFPLSLNFATTADATILNKSLEASNASMTQSVPELSLAQKLFSALTKVLQTKQTNVDGVLNLVR